VRFRYLCAGILIGVLLASVGLGRANAYSRARHVVYSVFPRTTAPAALRVLGCETGHRYNANAYNSRSGATGYFQVLQGNAGRVLFLRGYGTLRIVGHLLWNPWYNARVALFLSRGGRDWHEWSCRWAA
jgi:hypothetical protein